MQHKQDDHFPWLTKMTTPTSNGVHIVQVRSDITTTASLKNLNSTTNIHGRFITKVPLAMGSLVDRIEILRGDDDLQPASGQQGATNQRNVQGSRGRAGAYSRNLPFAWSSRSNRLGRRWDGDGSVLCLTPFFSSSPWEMKNVKLIFLHQTDYPSIFRHEHDRFET